MQSISKLGLPKMQIEPNCDWVASAIDNPGEQVYICYACHRDFLSVPTTHQIVKLSGTKADPAVISRVQSDELFDTWGLKHGEYEPGLYHIENNQAGCWWLFDKDSVFKMVFKDYNCLAKSYYHLSAEEALESFLQGTA